MSFNQPSMNGLNNFDTDEIESLITTNANNISTNTTAISNITSITPAQATAIATNSNKTGITTAQAQAITDNSNKTGITTAQATAIATNSAKVGITTLQAQNISLNNDKVGITDAQADAIANNSSAISTNATNISTNTTSISTINNNIEGITASSNVSTIDNQVVITNNNEPQFSIVSGSGSSGDTTMSLCGRRTGSQQHRHAKIDLQNDDSQVTPSVGNMCSIVGRVTNHGTNVGGLEIVNYVDGQNPTTALTMSPTGDFNIGGSFQTGYKLKINGTMNVTSSLYHIPQMTTYTFNKASVTNDEWGDGNRQNQIDTTRRSGTAFSGQTNGTIIFISTGTYKIKATGNLQSINYNDRLAFAIYLVQLNTSSNVTADYFQDENYSFFSWIYSRNTSDGAHGNLHFEDYLYIDITTNPWIQIRNKLDVNNRNFDETRPEANLNLYLNVEITKISDDNIYA